MCFICSVLRGIESSSQVKAGFLFVLSILQLRCSFGIFSVILTLKFFYSWPPMSSSKGSSWLLDRLLESNPGQLGTSKMTSPSVKTAVTKVNINRSP